jgi:hypothetical protein
MNFFNKVIFVEKEKIKYIGTNEDIQKQEFFKSFKKHLSSKNENQDKKDNKIDDDYFGMSNKSLLNLRYRAQETTEDNEMSESEKLIEKRVRKESIIDKLVEIENEKIKLKGKLMVEEELHNEKIGSNIYQAVIEYSGGYLQFFLVFFFAIIWQFTIIEGNIYLTHWSDEKDLDNEDKNIYRFMIYTLFGIACIFSLFLKEFLISKMNYNISDNFHNVMLENVISAPINLYHDITPFGQIMNKFTIDLDKSILFFRHFSSTLKSLCTLIGAIVVCITSNKYVLFFLPIIFFLDIKYQVIMPQQEGIFFVLKV